MRSLTPAHVGAVAGDGKVWECVGPCPGTMCVRYMQKRKVVNRDGLKQVGGGLCDDEVAPVSTYLAGLGTKACPSPALSALPRARPVVI